MSDAAPVPGGLDAAERAELDALEANYRQNSDTFTEQDASRMLELRSKLSRDRAKSDRVAELWERRRQLRAEGIELDDQERAELDELEAHFEAMHPAVKSSRQKLDEWLANLRELAPETEAEARLYQYLGAIMPIAKRQLPDDPEQLDGFLLTIARLALDLRSDDAAEAAYALAGRELAAVRAMNYAVAELVGDIKLEPPRSDREILENIAAAWEAAKAAAATRTVPVRIPTPPEG